MAKKSRQDLPLTRADLDAVIDPMKTDITDLKSDVSNLKTNVAILKTDVAGLKTDVSGLRTELKDSVKRLSLEIIQTQADVREIKASMSTKEDIRHLTSLFDAFSGEIRNSERARVLHGQAITEIRVELKDHDRRLTSLEARS